MGSDIKTEDKQKSRLETSFGGTVEKDIPESVEWIDDAFYICLLYTSPSPRDRSLSRMPSSA